MRKSKRVDTPWKLNGRVFQVERMSNSSQIQLLVKQVVNRETETRGQGLLCLKWEKCIGY